MIDSIYACRQKVILHLLKCKIWRIALLKTNNKLDLDILKIITTVIEQNVYPLSNSLYKIRLTEIAQERISQRVLQLK